MICPDWMIMGSLMPGKRCSQPLFGTPRLAASETLCHGVWRRMTMVKPYRICVKDPWRFALLKLKCLFFCERNQHADKISFPTTSKKRSNDKLQCQFLVDKYTKPGKFGSNRRTQTLNSVDLLSVWNHDEPGPRIVHIGLDRNLGACAFWCPGPCSVAGFPYDLDLRRLSWGTKGFRHWAAAVEAPQQQRPVTDRVPRGAALPVQELARQCAGGVPATGGGRET